MHAYAHQWECQLEFNPRLKPAFGLTDGEGVERRWWDIQPIANSTRMMGPGGRQGVLNDVWGFANWLKTRGLREYNLYTHLTSC